LTDNRNKLPVAVAAVSGGDASPRLGSVISSIADTSSGNVALGTARRFRVFPNLRSWTNKLFLLGFTNTPTLATAEHVLSGPGEIRETVPAGTTLYWSLVDTAAFNPVLGGNDDHLIVTKFE
jgi:hypothetical protein